MTRRVTDTDAALRAIRADTDSLLHLLDSSDVAATTVPTCPDWTVADLVGHVGGAQAWPLEILRAGGEMKPRDLPDPPRDPAALGPWVQTISSDLISAMRSHDPAVAVWTPTAAASDGNVTWWIRKMAVETALHRWDGQNAVGTAEPIDAAVAAHGIDEMVLDFLPMMLTAAGHGLDGTLHLQSPEDAWVIELGSGPSVTTLAGSSSDVLLFLWNRCPDATQRLRVSGDESVVHGWVSLTI